MNRVILFFVLLWVFAMRNTEAHVGAPQIKCEIGTAAWCIATFDGSISMQDAGEFRIWTLQARTDHRNAPMRIFEAKACSDIADEALQLVKADKSDTASSAAPEVVEYVLNSNGCKLRFEIPQSDSAATYRQVMLYGILVGLEKRTQLYRAQKR